jgi:hypothetical protein
MWLVLEEGDEYKCSSEGSDSRSTHDIIEAKKSAEVQFMMR